MRFLTLNELLCLHQRILNQSGGADGIRDLGLAESALAQPKMLFDGKELYATLTEKSAALCFSLIMNHPFIDGNKRVGHAALEIFLILNGYELIASVDDAESVILKLAAGDFSREEMTAWISEHMLPIKS